jgi:hypothetical protein
VRFEFEYGIVCFVFLLSLFRLENCVCLSRSVQVAGVAWRASMRTVAGVGDLVQRTGRWSHRSGTQWPGGQEVGWRHVRSAPGTWRLGARVSWSSLKTNVDGLSVVWPQNHWDGFSSVCASKPMATVCEWFGLKTTRMVFTSLTSKPVAMISSGLASKPTATVFAGLASKPAATVFSNLA